MAACGVVMTIGICYIAGWDLWPTGPRHIPHPSAAEVRASPEPFVEMVQNARKAQKSGMEAVAAYSTFCVRMLMVVSVLTLIAALTTPGKPRFLRFADWQAVPDLRKPAWLDFGLTTAALLLFSLVFLSARALRPDLSHPPVLPAGSEEVHGMLAREAHRMVLAARASLFVVGTAMMLFAVIFYRIARRLWAGLRAERRRRRTEANAVVVKQF
jgi:hypothetical protein